MGLATQGEIDKAVINAKKVLRDKEIMDVLKGCSYGGKPVTMVHTGGFVSKDFVVPNLNTCPLEHGLFMKGGDLKHGKTD